MRRKYYLIGGIVAALVLVVILGVLLRSAYLRSLLPVTNQITEPQLVEIASGSSSHQISQMLEDKGLINSRWAFQWYLYKSGISSHIQAGLYRFSPQQSTLEIAHMLASGDTAARSLTITGGMRLAQISQQLTNLGYSQTEVEEALSAEYPYSVLATKPPGVSLEGYLFPDTYRVSEGATATSVIDQILANTQAKITPQLQQAWAAQGLNINQGLTLASIVQREASNPSDQRVIAQVFLKRLSINMKLEADPTFEYAAYLLGTTPSIFIDSPYNTYVVAGLPPGPIAAVEQSALEAVANPASTDYLYFLADRDGNTHFSTDKAQHEENIQKYLR